MKGTSVPPDPRPPLAVRLVLRALLSEADRRAVVSELAEGWSVRRERLGDAGARRWYRRQAWQSALRFGLEAIRQGRRRSETGKGVAGAGLGDGVRDLRLAGRGLVRSPLLSLTVVLTVGLGLGASVAMFAVVHTVLVRPLPYGDAGELVRVYHALQGNRWSLSAVDYLAIKEQQTAFSAIAAYRTALPTLTRADGSERVRAKLVTPEYFGLLGVQPILGRGFEPEEGEPGGPLGVVVGWDFWQSRFAGDPGIIGEPLRLDGSAYTVVGVLPRGAGPLNERYDVFPVLQLEPPTRKGPFFLTVLGRLQPETTSRAAAAELRAINSRIFSVWQSSWQDESATYGVMPLREFVVGDVGTTLLVLLGAVAFVLLVAATNGANLLIARTAQREHELSIRTMLGATRPRIARLLATESLLLTLGSVLLGIGLAWSSVRALRLAGAGVVPRAAELGLGGPVALFTFALAIACCTVFGLAPSLLALRDPSAAGRPRGGSRTVSGGAGAERVRRALIVAEFAVAMPLLVGAGLLLNSFARLHRVDPGFTAEGLVSATLTLPVARYPDRETRDAFWTGMLERARGLPGIRAAGLADARPPRDFRNSNNFDLLDRPTAPGQSQPGAVWITATPGYFDVLEIPLRDGRMLEERDGLDGQWPVVVDEAWARHYYPGEDPIGRRFHAGGCTGDDCAIATVVGVVGDVQYQGLDHQGEGSVHGTVYSPASISPPLFVNVFVRGNSDGLQLVGPLRTLLRELDPELVLADIVSGEELIEDALASPRNLLLVVAAFAAVALILAVVGLYGVMAFYVQQHRREIGIRVALGEDAASVVRLVLGRGMRPVLLGGLVGLTATLVLTGFLRSVLFQVPERDVGTITGVGAVMLGTALLACMIPARRAVRLDPVRTLRDE